MHTKKIKRSKKKGIKSAIKNVRSKLALRQATADVGNNTKCDKDKVLDLMPFGKRVKGSSKNRHNKGRLCMSKKEAHVCTVCGVGFKTGVTLKCHLEHYGDPIYPCEECGTKFTDEKQLHFHIGQSHMLKPVIKFKLQCPVCGQLIMRTHFLRSHMYHYHEGWENLYPNLFDSAAASLAAVNNENNNPPMVPLEKDNYSVRSSEDHDGSVTPVQTKSSSTISSKNNILSCMPLETGISEKLSPKQNITSTILFESGISEKILPEQNILSTIPLDDITAFKQPRINVNEAEAVNNKITKTMVSENALEMSASGIVLTEVSPDPVLLNFKISSESSTTEATAPESKITEMKTAENYICETKSLGDSTAQIKCLESNITETMSLEDNTAEKQASETKNNTAPVNFQNHFNEDNQKSNGSSRLVVEMVTSIEKNTFTQQNPVESNIPATDSSLSSLVSMNIESNEVKTLPSVQTTTVLDEKYHYEKSPDTLHHHEEADKSDKTSFIKGISANVVMPVVRESNRDDDAAKHGRIDRETELKALNSCKDCYVLLKRLNISRIKKSRRVSPKITDCLSSGTLFPRRFVVSVPSIDVAPAKPKYRKIVSGPSTPFPCDYCNESFNTHASRILHIDLRHTVIPSIVCDKTFTTRQAILRHYRERHFVYTEDKTFCVCGMELVGQTAIHRHFYQYAIAVNVTKELPPASHNACHPLPKKFDCVNCGAKFWLKSCLEYHQTLCDERTQTAEPESATRATTIRKRYKRAYKPIRRHVCSVCETVFATAYQLANHGARYSRPEKYQCKLCRTVFTGPQLLSGHIRSAHQRESIKCYPYYCSICGQGFTAAAAERIHRMHFHRDGVSFANEDTSDSERDDFPMTDSDVSEDEATKECNVCGHEFTSGQRYINHLVYYTRNEVIECGICLEEFAGQYQAHRHNKLVHYTSESRDAFTHFCTICREGFMWKTHLHAHLCHVHGIPAIEAQCMMNLSDSRRNNNGFLNVADTCKICDITFPSPVLLAAHEIENLNDGEFVCNKCSRRCRTASILLDHLSLNHSSTIIQDGVKCRRCNEKFQTRSAWVSHVKHFHFSKEPSEFYFEKNIASSEKLIRSLRYELSVPTNSSISSGVTSFRLKSSYGDPAYGPETIAANEIIAGNADSRNFIKIESSNSTSECRTNGQMFGSSPEPPWTCTVCSVSFPGAAEFTRHTALFSDEGNYMCELCGRRFAWLSIYQEHKKKHYRNDVDKFFCPTCNEGFETLQSQTSHEAHLHKTSHGVNRPDDRNIYNSLQSTSPNSPRSLPHPKIPSIISFFQSESTTGQQSIPSLPALPEHRKFEEQCNETSCWPSHHTEIFEDELSMSYQCPNCHEKYRTLEDVHEHLMIAHNMKRDPTEVPMVESPEDMLEDSSEHYPDDSPEDASVNLAANLPEDSPEVSRPFVDSVKCEICDMNFVSENLLSIHRTTIHSSCPVVTRKTRNSHHTVEDSHSSKLTTSDHIYDTGRVKKLLPNGKVRKRRDQMRDRSSQSTKSAKRMANGDPNKLPSAGESSVVRCQICDILFMNRTILQAHEMKHHSWIFDDKQSIDDSSIQQLSLLVGKLPIAPKDVGPTAANTHFESVMLPAPTYDFAIVSPNTDESFEMLKPIEDTSSNYNVDSLPAGNYKHSQLTVRPFAKIAQKLPNQSVQKLEMDGAMESTETLAERT